MAFGAGKAGQGRDDDAAAFGQPVEEGNPLGQAAEAGQEDEGLALTLLPNPNVRAVAAQASLAHQAAT